MHVLGIIPARGGSKGIPSKNLVPLAGKPLLAHTCEQALNAKRLSRVILSTDAEPIAACARGCGIEVPFLRPAELARDETPMLEVLLHALGTLAQVEHYQPDVVVLLQPTSPLRRPSHIDQAVTRLQDTGADSVVSVVEVPHQFSPACLLEIADGALQPYGDGTPVWRRQDKPRLYARNGPAVLAVWRQTLTEQHNLYGARSIPLVMSPEESADIDSPAELAFAEFLLARQTQAARTAPLG